MIDNAEITSFVSKVRYFVFEKKFNGPRTSVLGLLLIPLVAYPLTLADYENTATVTASSDQYENVTSNNSSTVQVIPNAELVLVKEVVNDDGGSLAVTDFGITTSAGALVFGTGTTAICTISNDDVAPQLTLAKTIINDNGGDLTAVDFDLSVNSTVVTAGVAQTVAANTTHVIEELDLPGYVAGTWSCVDANGLTAGLPTAGAATGTNVVLSPGADVTCEISNDDIAPLLTLVKNVTNDNGGALTAADFDLSVDGTVVPDSTAQTVAANAAIPVYQPPELRLVLLLRLSPGLMWNVRSPMMILHLL